MVALTPSLTFDVPLGPLTWYGVGGSAAVFARPGNEQALQQVLQTHGPGVGRPLYVLGSGANLLVRDQGVDGLVVRLDTPEFAHLTIEGTTACVGGGYDLFKLVRELAKAGLAGLENIAGVPASVGGAVRMNAGGAFGEIGAYVEQVRVMDEQGRVQTLGRDQLQFDYRQSNIKQPIILEVVLSLSQGDPKGLTARMKEIFEYKKSVQPMGAKSAGCAFKNPPAPNATEPDQRLSAGKLIDEAGLKGFRIGSAAVSNVHGNFIHVTEKTGKADDVLAVIKHVEQVVFNRHGISLMREVVVWP